MRRQQTDEYDAEATETTANGIQKLKERNGGEKKMGERRRHDRWTSKQIKSEEVARLTANYHRINFESYFMCM